METYVVRVWLPDRPGALGQVASRIGAVRGDVIGIDILERGGGRAVDELVVSLPDGSIVDLLVAEIVQVDGVAVEEVRKVASDRPDAALIALEITARVAEAVAAERLELLCRELIGMLDGDWAVAFDLDSATAAVVIGDAPEAKWISAFVAGSSHLTEAEQGASAPGDLAWSRLMKNNLAVTVGRRDRPFHTRERQHVAILGRIVDSLIER